MFPDDPNAWIAIFSTLAAVVTALIAARNSAKQADIAALASKAKTVAEAQAAKDQSDGVEFAWMRAEITRQDKALNNRRTEIEGLWEDLSGVRKQLELRDQEMIAMRLELSSERAVSNAQSKRISELERALAELTVERDELRAALRAAGIEVPTTKRRGDTGPLPALPPGA